MLLAGMATRTFCATASPITQKLMQRNTAREKPCRKGNSKPTVFCCWQQCVDESGAAAHNKETVAHFPSTVSLLTRNRIRLLSRANARDRRFLAALKMTRWVN